MSCIRVPTSLDDADLLIQACSGVVEWRPVFLLGLGTLVAVVSIALVLAAAAWLVRR